MRKILLLSILSFLAVSNASAAFDSRHPAGTASGNFLKLGAGARYLALGETGAAASDDANALYWNPANLGFLKAGSLSIMQNSYVDAIDEQFGAAAFPAGRAGAFGLSVQRVETGDIRRTDDLGRELGHFAPRDLAVAAGWGRRVLRRAALGINVKFVQSTITRSAQTAAADVGISRFGPHVALAAVLKNAGGHLRYVRDRGTLPTEIHLGQAWFPTKRWVFNVEETFPMDAPITVGAGLERSWSLTAGSAVALRGGYNTRNRRVPGMQGVSAGLGVTVSRYALDYAWVPMGDFGQTHRFSLSFSFSPRKR